MLYKEALHVRTMLYVGLPIMIGVVLFVVGIVFFSTGPDAWARMDPGQFVLNMALLCSFWAASAFGSSLALETDGHLEVVFTRPVSRLRLALEKLSVDAAAIVLVYVLALGLSIAAYAVAPHRNLSMPLMPEVMVRALAGLAILLAWFGLSQMVTAGLRAGAQIAGGLMWPLAIGLVGLVYLPLPSALHTGLLALNTINPLAWAWQLVGVDVSAHAASPIPTATIVGFEAAIPVLVLLAAAGCLAAAYQWRRVEA